jgi:hypothetical protein
MRPDWFPDWQGHDVAIIASGPSTKGANVAALKGRMHAIAIKENVDVCKWADVVYGCDAAWWKNKIGLPKFSGLKVSWARDLATDYPDIRFVDLDKESNDILTDRPGFMGSGGNSGFQALNLAVQFGVARVLLIGFDMHDRSGVHWYGRNNGPGRNNPCEDNFRRWRVAFRRAAPVLAAMGVSVVNASQISDLQCFPKMTIERTLEEWRV